MIGTTVGHFRIEKRLGAGGMGEVWLAHDLKLDRKVALKFLHTHLKDDPDARARFEREARALAALDHPNVGAVYGVEDGYMVLAYIEGQPLSELLPLPQARAETLIPRIAEGLAAAHARSIVHRDLKPANIVVSGDVPKVVDFGIAFRGDETRLTQTGTYSGTTGYTAPEVYRGALADARSDVFALGVVFYEMIAGKRPFEASSSAATMHAVLNDTPSALASPFNDVIQRCLAKDPSKRYANAGEVVAALHGVEPVRKRKPPVAVFVAMALSIGVALWLSLGRSAKPPQTPATPGTPDKRAVAVLEFDNLSGDPSLDWMKKGASELVGSALVQSPELDVYDGQRLADLLANDKAEKIDNAFLARHGITRAIDGTILKSGSQLQVLGRIVDTKDGRPVRSYNVSGPADSGLFHVVGGLIPNLQVALEVNLTGDKEAEGWLREITTTSADAYRLYLRGHQALLASHWKESAAAFEKAVELDPNFAAAWSEMSGAYWNLDDQANLERARAAMRRLRPTADHRTQLKIDLQEAVVSGDAPGIVRAASELSQLYPENRFYTYLLGRGYYTTHQYQRCLDTLAPLVAQRYSWAYTYVLSARSAERLGDLAKAKSLYETGLEVSKGEPELAYPYAKFLHDRGDDANARRVIETGLASPTLAESPVAEGELRLELAKNYSGHDEAQARAQLLKASPLIPKDDEARAEADSLLKHYGLR